MRINISDISISFQAETQAESCQLDALKKRAEEIKVKTYNFDNRIDGGNEYGLGIYIKDLNKT
jgi:hypothetical protein